MGVTFCPPSLTLWHRYAVARLNVCFGVVRPPFEDIVYNEIERRPALELLFSVPKNCFYDEIYLIIFQYRIILVKKKYQGQLFNLNKCLILNGISS